MKKLLILSLFFTSFLKAQTIDTTLWMVSSSGQVNDIVKDNNILYIGGTFTKLAVKTGAFAIFDQSDAKKNTSTPVITPGVVNKVVSDGSGGWFVAGGFTTVNGLAYTNIIHILANGKLNTSFKPAPNGAINTMVVRNGKLYVAGQFSSIAGQSRSNIAEFDIASGLLTTWSASVNGAINTLVISGTKLYMGGAFTTVNAQPRQRAACLDLNIGINTDWNPAVAGGAVNVMLVHGDRIFIGGTFSTIGGETRNRIAAVDTLTGTVLAWNPDASGAVQSLAASGSLIYIGGSFSSIGGFGVGRLAAIDSSSSSATTWAPNPDGAVNAIAIDGVSVLVGGAFSNIGGQAQRYAARINNLGQCVPWDPGINSTVMTLTLSGGKVILGGGFSTANEITRNRLAAIDLTTGEPTAWNPNVNNAVNALAMTDSAVIAGGSFSTVAGTSFSRLVAIDKTSGMPNASWLPNPSNTVYSLLVNGQTIYVGGAFSSIGGQSRSRLGAIDLSTGLATSFNPNVNNTVFRMILNGPNLFIAGNFSTVGSASRNRIASINVNSGGVTNWNPNANNTVNALVLAGSVIYAGGDFTNFAGASKSRLAAIDTNSSTVTPKSWGVSVNNDVRAMVLSGSTLYVGGDFSTIGGQGRSKLAAVDTIGAGQVLPWNAAIDDNVFALYATNDCGNETVYVGGVFATIKGNTQRAIVALSGSNRVAISRSVTNPTCNSLNNGEVILAVSGGQEPFSFSKDGITYQDTGRFAGLTAGNYTFRLKDANGCVLESFATLTEPSPIVANEVIFNETCEGQLNGAVNINPTGGQAPYTFNWSNGTTNQNATGLAGGSYTVVIKDNSDCQKSQVFEVGSNPLPEADFGISFDQGAVSFTDQSSGNPNSFAWDFGDGGISTQPNPVHTYQAMGNYKVCLMVTNDCGSDSSCKIINSTALDKIAGDENNLRLMPNPSHDYTIVATELPLGTTGVWMLTDLTGRMVIAPIKVSEGMFRIDLSELNKGVFLFHLIYNNQTTTKRLVKI